MDTKSGHSNIQQDNPIMQAVEISIEEQQISS